MEAEDGRISGVFAPWKSLSKIRDGILKGEYKENEELRESTIGKKLGVSRTPVREALRQLELEGLVKSYQTKAHM